MSIRWTKTVEVEQQVKLVVDTNPDVEPDDLDELLGALRDATLADLRDACEAVGLYSTDLDEQRTRAEKAERARELAVNHAEQTEATLERLRLAMGTPSSANAFEWADEIKGVCENMQEFVAFRCPGKTTKPAEAWSAVAKFIETSDLESIKSEDRIVTKEAELTKALARVAELDTALRNAAHGIATGEAAPIVHTMRARHDEKEAEWEKERETLVERIETLEFARDNAVQQITCLESTRDHWKARAETAEAELEGAKKRILSERATFELALEGFAELLGVDNRRDLLSRDGVGRLQAAINSVQADEAKWSERAETAEAELAALKAPVAGEPSAAQLHAIFDRTPDLNDLRMRAVWRAGHAAGLAKAQPTAERATDEELVGIWEEAAENSSTVVGRLRAVAARVRAERAEKGPASPAPDAPAGSGVEVVPVSPEDIGAAKKEGNGS